MFKAAFETTIIIRTAEKIKISITIHCLYSRYNDKANSLQQP